MVPSNRISSHPGDVLLAEYLEPRSLSVGQFAEHLGLPDELVAAFVEGDSPVTAELAWLLGMATGTGPELWMNL